MASWNRTQIKRARGLLDYALSTLDFNQLIHEYEETKDLGSLDKLSVLHRVDLLIEYKQLPPELIKEWDDT